MLSGHHDVQLMTLSVHVTIPPSSYKSSQIHAAIFDIRLSLFGGNFS